MLGTKSVISEKSDREELQIFQNYFGYFSQHFSFLYSLILRNFEKFFGGDFEIFIFLKLKKKKKS